MADHKWLERLVASFGEECKHSLGETSEDEAAIRRAVENLLTRAAQKLGLLLYLHPEARRPDLGIRPDLAARIGASRHNIVGYIELKSPQKRDISPKGLRGNDRKQWEGMSKLPNLIYTNGQVWILYRLGEQRGQVVRLEGDLYRVGGRLRVSGDNRDAFEKLLRDFLSWQPSPIRTVGQLVGTLAPLCKLLRDQVRDRLKDEALKSSIRRSQEQPFTELANTWEQVLFPRTDERDPHAAFSDRYAQTITFSLLLARAGGISLTDHPLHEIGELLGADHSVMGRALQVLTDHVGQDFRNSLDMLVRVIGAVDWDAVLTQEPNAHVHLYEHFLQEYDKELRKASGTYYTPAPLVHEMVRLVDETLRLKLDCPAGFADNRVAIIDPAMGTGTFLSHIIDLVAERRSAGGNAGFRAESIEELAQRLIGFERQMAAYAVAQMRIMQTLQAHDSHIRLNDLRLHIHDTLADPWKPSTLFDAYRGAGLGPLIEDTETANKIKREQCVTVVIGNPPDRERAQGEGGWIELGSAGKGAPLLDRFRLRGANGMYENKLKNLYVYFWRWATYKVFEQHYPEHQQGVVCFVTTAGFMRGQGFRGMREYLRSTCTEGWVIDLTPEGKQPPVRTRFFPSVQRELVIAIFVRRPNESQATPAPVHYAALTGSRDQKLQQLSELHVDGRGWRLASEEPHAPFTPASTTGWEKFPALGELMPWKRQGIQTKRTWVYGVDEDHLQERWNRLIDEPNLDEKSKLFRDTEQWTINSIKESLPGYAHRSYPLLEERGECPKPVRITRRSLDRQWLIPDSRLIDRPAPNLWEANNSDQIFIVEQHLHPISSGPALIFSHLIPDMDCFNNRGGRVLPLRYADGSANLAPGFLQHLANSYGIQAVTAGDFAAYVAAISAQPAFTRRFLDDLVNPEVRIPLTADRKLWSEGIRLGQRLIWAATFGERYVCPEDGRPAGATALWERARPEIRYARGIDPAVLPESLGYDAENQMLIVGTGAFSGVSQQMREYDVGGRNILDGWFAARGARPTGRVGSDLDKIRSHRWRPEWSREIVELLSVLRHLTELESEQASFLEDVLHLPLIDVAELSRRGVLESPPRTRESRPPEDGGEVLPGLESLDGQETPPVQPLASPPAPETAPSPSPRRPLRGSRSRPARNRRHGHES